MDELSRLQSTLRNVLNLAQAGRDCRMCERIVAITRQALVPECAADCAKKHSVAELARLESVSHSVIYKYFPGGGFVPHDAWRNRFTRV